MEIKQIDMAEAIKRLTATLKEHGEKIARLEQFTIREMSAELRAEREQNP